MPSILPFALSTSVLVYFPLIYTTYLCIRTLYRLTFHPLAHFPGPKVAAATRWYEAYWELYQGGRFSQQIEHLHQQYGPIVRVTPNELHVNDPEFYDQLYNFSPDIDRPWTTLNNLQHSQSFELHKRRRRALAPYFSKPAIIGLEEVISSNVEELCQRIYEAQGSQKPLSVTLLARCLTSEIISEYLTAKPYGFLADPKQSEPFFLGNNSIFRTFVRLS